MTTIVYKNGFLAGDTLISQENNVYGYRRKIFDLEKFVVGFAGEPLLFNEFLKFLKGDEFERDAFKEVDHFCAIVVEKDTKKITCYDKRLIAIADGDIETDFIAAGTGAQIAKGALLMGATAKQAVECAAKIDYFTGGEILEIKCFSDPKKKTAESFKDYINRQVDKELQEKNL